MSPESSSRKRTRLEDQLSDIQYIDCSTPENSSVISTTAIIHVLPEVQKSILCDQNELYQPKNKSPRNSEVETDVRNPYCVKYDEDKRQSLNFERADKTLIPKSFTEADIGMKSETLGLGALTTPTPQSPNYRRLIESSGTTTPDLSPQPEICYEKLKGSVDEDAQKKHSINNQHKKPKSPTYENILTTISITYKSPTKVPSSPTNKLIKESTYDDVLILNPEKAMVPTTPASLPDREAVVPVSEEEISKIQASSHPNLLQDLEKLKIPENDQRPKSLNDLENYSSINNKDFKENISTNAIFNSSSQIETSITDKLNSQQTMTLCQSDSLIDSSMVQKIGSQNTLTSSRSSDLNQKGHGSNTYQCIENLESPSDFSLSEVVNSSTENLHTSQSSISFNSPTRNSMSPNVSPTQLIESPISISFPSQNDSTPSQNLMVISQSISVPSQVPSSVLQNLSSFEIKKSRDNSESSLLDVSISEPQNSKSGSQDALSSTENKSDVTFFNISELVSYADDTKITINSKEIPNLIEFSPVETLDVEKNLSDKRKSCETEESNDENSIYQQVKYFRRSIHEINALLELDKNESNSGGQSLDNADSLNEIVGLSESENSSSGKNAGVYENVKVCESAELCENTRKVLSCKGNDTEKELHKELYRNTGLYENTELYENAGLYENTGLYENIGLCGNTGQHKNTDHYENNGVYKNTEEHIGLCENARIYENAGIQRIYENIPGNKSESSKTPAVYENVTVNNFTVNVTTREVNKSHEIKENPSGGSENSFKNEDCIVYKDNPIKVPTTSNKTEFNQQKIESLDSQGVQQEQRCESMPFKNCDSNENAELTSSSRRRIDDDPCKTGEVNATNYKDLSSSNNIVPDNLDKKECNFYKNEFKESNEKICEGKSEIKSKNSVKSLTDKFENKECKIDSCKNDYFKKENRSQSLKKDSKNDSCVKEGKNDFFTKVNKNCSFNEESISESRMNANFKVSNVDAFKLEYKVDSVVGNTSKRNKIESPKAEAKIQTPKIPNKINPSKFQKKIESPKLHKKIESPKLQNKIESPKILNKTDSPKIHNDSSISANKINLPQIRNKIDSTQLEHKNESSKQLNKIDSTQLRNKIDSTQVQNKSDLSQLQNKIDSAKIQAKDSSKTKNVTQASVEDLRNKFLAETSTQKPNKKTYDRESLPPCLRARNLKHSTKTRSLDEEEFQREFSDESLQRRKSFDESAGFKVNTLPKQLNQPKKLPLSDDKLGFHLAHSTENINLSQQKLNRERIEKYKEERRKFFNDKYKSESFKEDKDVILSRLKTYKFKEDEKPKTNSKFDEFKEEFSSDSLEYLDNIENSIDQNQKVDDLKSSKESFRLKAAKFELKNNENFQKTKCDEKCNVEDLKSNESFKARADLKSSVDLKPNVNLKSNADLKSNTDLKPRTDLKPPNPTLNIDGKSSRDSKPNKFVKNIKESNSQRQFEVVGKESDSMCDLVSANFIKSKRKEEDSGKGERRRHTYEVSGRERESDVEKLRRTSLENRSPK